MARLSNKAYATPIPTFRLYPRFKMLIALLAFLMLRSQPSVLILFYINMNMLHIRKSKCYNVNFSYIYKKKIVTLHIPLMSVTVNIIALTLGSRYFLGDVHPNPGPLSCEGSSSSHISDLYNFLNYPNHLSTVHYNVQSIRNKVDILYTEFSQFDVISFSETWLNRDFLSTNLHFPSFHCPERKDRENESYGGVIVYVKNNLLYVRKHDLEINGLECVLVHIKLCNNKHILYGVFYRPPNSIWHIIP